MVPGLGYLVAGRIWLAVGGFLVWLVPNGGWLALALAGHRTDRLGIDLILLLARVAMAVHAGILASCSGPVRPAFPVAALALCLLPLLGDSAPASLRHAIPVRIIPSSSMEPAVNPGDTVLLNPWARDCRVGDVVTLHRPGDDRGEVIKWVAAGAGDTLEIRDGIVLVNGAPSPLPFKEKCEFETAPVQVPPGAVFVLGANLNNSMDSRAYGPVSLERLTGKMIGKF